MYATSCYRVGIRGCAICAGVLLFWFRLADLFRSSLISHRSHPSLFRANHNDANASNIFILSSIIQCIRFKIKGQ
jgi:hypothetical protein